MKKDKQIINVGVISDAYHMQGLVEIKTFTSNPDNICTLKCVYEDSTHIDIKKGPGSNTYRIEGVTTRTDAEKLIGKKIYIYKAELPEPSDNEFYMEDLIGVSVEDMDNKNIGVVKGCFNFGAGDILDIEFKNKKSEMILFTEENFPEVTKYLVKMRQ